MNKENISIIQLFPDFEEKIDFLFQTNEDFQDLCKDYLLCVTHVSEMKQTRETNSSRLTEYEDLKKNLHQEIMELISR